MISPNVYSHTSPMVKSVRDGLGLGIFQGFHDEHCRPGKSACCRTRFYSRARRSGSQRDRKEKKVSCLQRAGIQSCSLKVKSESRPIRAKIYNMPPLRAIRTPGSTRPNSNVTMALLYLKKKCVHLRRDSPGTLIRRTESVHWALPSPLAPRRRAGQDSRNE